MDEAEARIRAAWKAAADRDRARPAETVPIAPRTPRRSGATSEQRVEFQADATDPRHGTENGYRALGCRCDRCRAAATEGMRRYRAARNDEG
ncbi:hypothetical protein GCM10009869_01820 [Amnibacterium kyonggiense]